MDYLCLAAGKGTRFGQLGRYLQKCMYPVGLRPFVEYSIRNLRESRHLDPGRDRLTLVVGHRGEQLRDYFGAAYDGLTLEYLEQPEALGTGHALALAYEALQPERPVIAWLADLYVPKRLFERLQSCEAPNAQTRAPGHPNEKPDLMVSAEGGRVTRAWRGEGGRYDIGLWKLEPEVLANMAEAHQGEYRALPNLQRALERGHLIAAVEAEEWLHLGGVHPTPEANVVAVARSLWELEGAREAVR